MSLDVYLMQVQPCQIYSRHITDNLGKMADAAGIYEHLWRPDEIGIKTAGQLIEPLRGGLARLGADPEGFQALNPSNGWGSYKNLCEFVASYLAACEDNPNATVMVSR
jgi:hypothetical protein